MNCVHCGNAVQPNARFCGHCGKDVSLAASSGQLLCPQCRSSIGSAHRFCAKCGFDLKAGASALPPEQAEITPSKVSGPDSSPQLPARRRNWLLALLALAALVVMLAGVWWIWGDQRQAELAGGVPNAPAVAENSAKDITVDGEVLWERADAASSVGDLAQAVALLRELRNQSPDVEVAAVNERLAEMCRSWANQAAAHADKAVLDALACVSEVLPDDPVLVQQDWWRDYFAAAELLLAGESAQATQLLEPLSVAVPAEFTAGRHLGLLYDSYVQQGDLACDGHSYEAGRAWYLKARSLDPTRIDAGNRLATCLPPTATPTITPTPTSTPTPLPPGGMQARYTQEGRFNVRMGPGFNYPIVAMVDAGAVFTVTGRTQDATWLEVVDTTGRTVWVLSELVDTDYPASAAATVLSTPMPPTDYVVADSVADFGPKQGDKRWFYAASKTPGSLDFDLIPLDGGWYRWTAGGRNQLMRLSAEGSYPSWNSDAMRVWVNFYQGTLRIEGRASKEQGAGYGGNGVGLRIVHRRPATDQMGGFERELWRGDLGPYDTNGITFGVNSVEVEQRDEIYFVTSAQGDDQKDNSIFTARIILVNEGGVALAPTETPTVPPTSTPVPPLCFEPRLRHFEEHRGCCGEVVGIAYTDGGRLSWGSVHIEGPPATNQYKRDFAVNQDGGYEITALTAFPTDSIYYTIWLTGSRIKSRTYEVRFLDPGRIRAVVDFFQVPCW